MFCRNSNTLVCFSGCKIMPSVKKAKANDLSARSLPFLYFYYKRSQIKLHIHIRYCCSLVSVRISQVLKICETRVFGLYRPLQHVNDKARQFASPALSESYQNGHCSIFEIATTNICNSATMFEIVLIRSPLKMCIFLFAVQTKKFVYAYIDLKDKYN